MAPLTTGAIKAIFQEISQQRVGRGRYARGAAGGSGSATGGTIYTYGLYTVHHFPNPSRKSPAPYTFVVNGPLIIDYAIIAGGGSGGAGDPGAYSGGGGGAGGVLLYTSQPISTGTYPIDVGKGGTEPGPAEYNTSGNGDPGSPSTFNGATAAGGGYGAGTGNGGGSGGSGGGPSHANASTATGNVPATPSPGRPVQGYPSGAGSPSYSGGGGGGAGGAGNNRTGGAAINLSPYFGTSLGVSGSFAGGGGAGYYLGPVAPGGGGGAGPSGGPGTDGQDATLSTGSGGGGSDGNHSGPRGTSYGAGGAGAPGIVIIRYLTP